MNIYAQVAEKIIKEQENIIGPIALEQAKKVPGLSIDESGNTVTISGDEKTVLEKLVEQYKGLFGQTSVEVCKHAAKSLLSSLPQNQIPQALM